MPELNLRSIDDLQAMFFSSLALNNSPLTDESQGSTIYTLSRAFAALQADTDVRLSKVLKSFFISEAEGPDLDARVKDFGLVRQPGTPAQGYVLIKPELTAISLLPQTILIEPLTTLQFVTLNTSPITAEPLLDTRVAVTALEGGTASNLPAGTFLLIQGQPRVSSYVGTERKADGSYCTPLSGGSNLENDLQLRIRATSYIQSRRGTTVRSIRSELMKDPSIEWVHIRERLPGLIEVWLDSPVPLSPSVIKALTSVVDSIRPAGVLASVFQVSRFNLSIEVRLSISVNLDSERANSQLSSAIESYLFELSLGTTLKPQELEYSLQQTFPQYSPKLLAPKSNVTLPDRTVPRIGNLVIHHDLL